MWDVGLLYKPFSLIGMERRGNELKNQRDMKMNSQWIIDLNIKRKTVKLLRNTRTRPKCLWVR